MWFDARRRAEATALLGHAPVGARARVHRAGNRSVVVLDEVAHTRPITAGFVIEAGRLVEVRVLVYRESYGGAVRQPSWLAGFAGRGLGADGTLDGAIDGISGATLSVGAMTRMARFALWLAREAGAPEH